MNDHTRRILADKNKPVHSPETLAEYHRTHWYCLACGRDCEGTVHHIIGGRGGRSDEFPNLFYACWFPCHSVFADMTKNLGAVLAMKARAGELDAAGESRLEALNGKRLPEVRVIPEHFQTSWKMNRPELSGFNPGERT